MNGHLGALPWPVDRKVAEAGDVRSIKMMISIANEFTGFLGGGRMIKRVVHRIVFGERNLGIISINRGRGGKDQPAYSIFLTGFQKIHGPADIHICVKQGVLYGRSDSGPGSEMGHDFDLPLLKDILEEALIPQVSFNQAKLGVLLGLLQVAALQGGVVEIIKIIEADDPMPFGEKPLNQMRSNKTRAASDQITHHLSFRDEKNDLPQKA